MRPKPTKPRGEPPEPEKDARIAFCVARGLHEFKNAQVEFHSGIDTAIVSKTCDGPCKLTEYRVLPANHPEALRVLEAL